MLLLAASLFLTNPAPLDMPRAEAFLMREDGVRRLEDRYNRMDLWVASVSLGRWVDEAVRVFSLYRLDTCCPAVDADGVTTRTAFAQTRVALARKDEVRRREAIAALSPVPVFETGRAPRQLPRGYADVEYWQEPTNRSAVVCAFRPEKSPHWYLAVWELDDGDDIFERMGVFEEKFLVHEFKPFLERLAATGADSPHAPPRGRRRETPSERERLRVDAHRSVAPYGNWRWTDAPTYTVLDDLTRCGGFVATLTNALPTLCRSYAETVPTPLDGTNVLCVARLFDDRREYLEALAADGAEEMAWTAAYWSPLRRELVAYLPDGGEKELMKTFRHEAFHQYLSYACSMIPASPWFNEGYAQYFEDTSSTTWGEGLEPTPDGLARLAETLPGVFGMDYEAFYAGSNEARRLKYRLAWSVAVFLEKGAPKVRFQPFKNLKRDYVESLLETRDMRRATSAAFGSKETLDLFVAEWKRFWLER